MRLRPLLCQLAPTLGLLLLASAGSAAAVDGELDTETFYPPFGAMGSAGAGLVADGGLVAPDGTAIALIHQPGAAVTWRTVPGFVGPATSCTFTPPLAAAAEYHDAIFDGSGRLVLVGTATFPGLDGVIFATRYLYPECELDDTFSDDGYFTFDHVNDLEGRRVRRQVIHVLGVPVERLLIAGDQIFASGGGPGADDFADTLILRLKGDGELDASFDGDGWASLGYEFETQFLADFVVDRQNRIVFGANVDLFSADSDFVVGRLLTSGELDPAFDSDGWKRMRFSTDAADALGAMEVAANGDVLLAGTADLGTPRHLGVVRMNDTLTEGTLIETAGTLSVVTSAVLQGDRKLLLAGWSNGLNGDADIFALRVDVPESGAPAVDPTFGSGAAPDPLTYLELDSDDGGTDAAWAIDLAAGKPVLFGEENFGDPQGMFVARLWNGYIFADGFESGDRSAW